MTVLKQVIKKGTPKLWFVLATVSTTFLIWAFENFGHEQIGSLLGFLPFVGGLIGYFDTSYDYTSKSETEIVEKQTTLKAELLAYLLGWFIILLIKSWFGFPGAA